MNPYKILLVDDHVDSLTVTVNYLRSSGMEVTIFQTKSSVRALEIATSVQPDVIITDWDMPEMDGIELVKQLKQIPHLADIPVIMATGVMLTSQNLKLALDAGAFDYLRKPIDPIELHARVHSAIVISQYHRRAIEKKNNELAENAVFMVKNNEFNMLLKQQMEQLQHALVLNADQKQLFASLITHLDERIRTNGYDKFEMAFKEVHPNFIRNLIHKFPDLTASEIKLCTFIRLGMNIKDVASMLFLSPDSIKVARSRLRKKLNLDNSQNIEVFMLAF